MAGYTESMASARSYRWSKLAASPTAVAAGCRVVRRKRWSIRSTAAATPAVTRSRPPGPRPHTTTVGRPGADAAWRSVTRRPRARQPGRASPGGRLRRPGRVGGVGRVGDLGRAGGGRGARRRADGQVVGVPRAVVRAHLDRAGGDRAVERLGERLRAQLALQLVVAGDVVDQPPTEPVGQRAGAGQLVELLLHG